MESPTLQCPKCGHPRRTNPQCPSCGIVFEKYVARERRQLEQQIAHSEQRGHRRRWFVSIIAAATITASTLLAVYFYVRAGSDEQQVVDAGDNSKEASRYSRNPYEKYMIKSLVSPAVEESLKAATFGVLLDKYTGTGFFVTDSCLALTNKIDILSDRDKEREINYKSTVDFYDRAYRDSKKDFIAKRDEFFATCHDCSQKAYLARLGKDKARMERKLEELRQQQEKRERFAKRDNSIELTFKRKRYKGKLVDSSNDFDVSLIVLDNGPACNPVSIAKSDSMKKGDEVYLMGWDHRITKGNITGILVSPRGQKFIMHDANPAYIKGYIGAPAFNKSGEVIGISVPKISKDLYLVPIEDALLEFNVVL